MERPISHFRVKKLRSREATWFNQLFSPSWFPRGVKARGSLHKDLLCPQVPPLLGCALALHSVPLHHTFSWGLPSPRGTALGTALLKSYKKSDMRDEKLPKPHRGAVLKGIELSRETERMCQNKTEMGTSMRN